jgi:hypothetical protein
MEAVYGGPDHGSLQSADSVAELICECRLASTIDAIDRYSNDALR